MRTSILAIPFLLASFHSGGFSAETPADRHNGYIERAQEVIEWRADRVDLDEPDQGGLHEIGAKFALGEDIDWASQRLVDVLESPRGDMFWMFPVTAAAYLGQDQMTEEAQQALRDAWRTYMPQRGDTENHWAMYYVTLFLMSEYWPDLGPEDWFTGKSSAENREEAKKYLTWWIDLTTSVGQGEYDNTHYIGEYLIVMLYLAAWAEDPEMRQRGRMMVDYIAADFAVDTLDGMYVGAHARTDDRQVRERWYSLSTFFAWLFFDNVPPPPNYGGWGISFALAAQYYQLPEAIYRIATDRDGPYTHRERKRTRQRWRNADERIEPVYKTTYVTENYAVGSDQGGLFSPIQQHSWSLTWAEDDPRGVHNTIFSINPHWSEMEMQMFFTEYPDFMPVAVTNQGKPTYMDESTFLGGSPYEQIHQEKDAVVVLYNMPEGANHEHVNGLFSKDLKRIDEDDSGWIFVQGGKAYIAYYPLADYEWRDLEEGDQWLYSPSRKNGTILQAASADEFESWDAFKQTIRELPLETDTEGTPSARFTSLRGDEIFCVYDETPVVNGEPVDYENWPLFGSPYLQADPHSRYLKITHGQLMRELDFEKLQITDRVIEKDPQPFAIDAIRPQ